MAERAPERTQSPAYEVLGPSSRHLLAYVEQEIERQGGCAKIYDDMFVVVGSRKVVTPGLA